MKEIKSKKFNIVILIILLNLTFASCINKTPAKNPTIEIQKNIKNKLTENSKDTLPKLKFKSVVRSLFEDRNGNLWMGSDKEGVARFNGISFTYFNGKDGLWNLQIRTIQEDQDGNIWVATGEGVYKYDGKSFLTETPKFDIIPDVLPEMTWKKEANDLWFNGELDGGIYRYDGQNLHLLEFPKLEPDHKSFSITGTVTGICHGKNNMTWMANYGGVIGYDGKSFTYINERGIDYHVRSIFEDSRGILWIGNNGIGVLRYDGFKTVNFTEENNISDPQGQRGGIYSPEGTLNHVFAIAEDKDGNVWFGDRDAGAWKYDGKTLTNYTKYTV